MIRPGTSVKENERSRLASREVQYSVKDARDGSVAKVALQCTDVRTKTSDMSDNVTLCSPVMGVRDRVNGSFREGRKEGVCVSVTMLAAIYLVYRLKARCH